MVLRQSILLLVTVISLSACGDVITSPDLFPIAKAFRTCGAAGGSAVGIELTRDVDPATESRQPMIRIAIWRDISEIAKRTYRLDQNSPDGFAVQSWIPTVLPPSFAEPLTGSVEIRRVERDSTIVGFLDLRYSDGTRFARAFAARWQSYPGTFCL